MNTLHIYSSSLPQNFLFGVSSSICEQLVHTKRAAKNEGKDTNERSRKEKSEREKRANMFVAIYTNQPKGKKKNPGETCHQMT